MNNKELIEQAIPLPVEERTLVVDALLRSLHAPKSVTDSQWASETKRRLSEPRAGKVKAVPGEAVFEHVRDRFRR